MNGRKISGIRVSAEIMRDYLVLEFFVAEAATMAAFVGNRILSGRFCLAGLVIAMLAAAAINLFMAEESRKTIVPIERQNLGSREERDLRFLWESKELLRRWHQALYLPTVIFVGAALLVLYKLGNVEPFLNNFCALYAGKLLFSGCIFCVVNSYFEKNGVRQPV